MKALRAHDWCDPEGLKWEEIPTPEPGVGEARIKVGAAALNFPDMLMIKGTYQIKPKHPFTPGMELSGTIDELGGEATGFAPGQRVMAQCGLGAFAEYAIVPIESLHFTPPGMSDDEAASFPLVYQTSYFGLAYRGQLKKGDTVLVHSAAGGVGLAAVQIARAMGAGLIIGTAGSDEKLEIIRQNGADLAINYETQDFALIVNEKTGGQGADIIYDPVGGTVGERSTKCIAFEGRILVIGFTSGAFPVYKANHILIKNYSIVGLHWGNYRRYNPELVDRAWRELFELYGSGYLKPVVAARFPMERAADAMAFLASRKAAGKIILHP